MVKDGEGEELTHKCLLRDPSGPFTDGGPSENAVSLERNPDSVTSVVELDGIVTLWKGEHWRHTVLNDTGF